MGKQEYLANGGVEGVIYDNRWKIALPATFVLGVATRHFVPGIVYNFQEAGRQRQADLYRESTKSLLLELGIGTQARTPVTQDISTDSKEIKMLSEITEMLKHYGERIARLEGKTESKPGDSS